MSTITAIDSKMVLGVTMVSKTAMDKRNMSLSEVADHPGGRFHTTSPMNQAAISQTRHTV